MKVSCKNVCKIYGSNSIDVIKQCEDMTKEEILEKTGQVIAVKNVSFDVNEGETFVIMGLSGSGKSTLIRCLSRLIEPTSGTIEVDREDVAQMSKPELRELRRHKMSMVFQYFGLFPHRDILDNITYGLEIQGVAKAVRREKGTEILELVGLKGWGSYFPRELSGGMQQRVGLARALAVDPEILLFDEPFSALDPLIRRNMQDELLQLRKVVKKAMIFITHDFMEAIRLADNMAIMKDGEFVQVGTPEELVLNPVNQYVRDFTEEVPIQKILSARAIMKNCDVVISDSNTVGFLRDMMESSKSDVAFINNSEGKFAGTIAKDKLTAKGIKASAFIYQILGCSAPISPHTTTLDALIPLVAKYDGKCPVIDESNNLLGYVDREIVMTALSGHQAAA